MWRRHSCVKYQENLYTQSHDILYTAVRGKESGATEGSEQTSGVTLKPASRGHLKTGQL